MKTNSHLLRKVGRPFRFSQIGVLAIFLISAVCTIPAAAQTNDATVSQLPSRPAPITKDRITQAIDEKQLVLLRGNVHPLAQARSDLGAVNDAQPLDRMLLLLQRAP